MWWDTVTTATSLPARMAVCHHRAVRPVRHCLTRAPPPPRTSTASCRLARAQAWCCRCLARARALLPPPPRPCALLPGWAGATPFCNRMVEKEARITGLRMGREGSAHPRTREAFAWAFFKSFCRDWVGDWVPGERKKERWISFKKRDGRKIEKWIICIFRNCDLQFILTILLSNNKNKSDSYMKYNIK
jgi:hypothetical protein